MKILENTIIIIVDIIFRLKNYLVYFYTDKQFYVILLNPCKNTYGIQCIRIFDVCSAIISYILAKISNFLENKVSEENITHTNNEKYIDFQYNFLSFKC